MNTYKIETLEEAYRIYYIEAPDAKTAEEILYEEPKDEILEILDNTEMSNDEYSTMIQHNDEMPKILSEAGYIERCVHCGAATSLSDE